MTNVEKYGYEVAFQPLFPNFQTLFNLTRVMQSGATGFAIIAAIIIAFIEVISTIILLSSRKYEIAVLRSVGMKKRRLIASYLIENLVFIWVIAVVSLAAAQFIAPVFTGSVFEGIQKLVSVEIFEKLTGGSDINLILQNAGLVFGGTTVVVVLSMILTCVNIIRFEPLKIFNKQY